MCAKSPLTMHSCRDEYKNDQARLGFFPPPPPCLGTALRKNRLLVPRSNSRIVFYKGIGFFMFLVDVGQLFRCTGHHFMCVATGPPIRGDPISHSQAHIPLKPGAAHGHAQEPTPGSAVEFWGESVRKNRPLVLRSNIAGSWARGGGGGHSV